MRSAGAQLRFTKHHGAGNDFLVILQPPDGAIGPDEVRALCNRSRGVGADGLIVGLSGNRGADLEMVLTNADGSPAEMSGNGIRCLVQAAVDAGMTKPGMVVVDTDAGRRSVEYKDLGAGLGWGEVDMGPALLGRDLPLDVPPAVLAGPGLRRACEVDVGNPHVVLLDGDEPRDVRVFGPLIERAVVGGTNVEIVRRVDGPSIEIDVWERGVGVTGSCGTGACAAAAASRSWGLVGDDVEVRSGGGALQVKLGPGNVTLSGPARMIGTVTVDSELLSALAAEQREEVVAAP